MHASSSPSEQVCTAERHSCSACKTWSQPGDGVVKHGWGHHTRLNLRTRFSESLWLHMNASSNSSVQVCIAGRHCCSACNTRKTGSQPGHGVVKHSLGHHTSVTLCRRCSESLWLHKHASTNSSEQVRTAGRHCCSACKTGSQPGHGVVKHSLGHHTILNLCARCSESLWLHKHASSNSSEQVRTAGRHCCSARKTGSQPGHVVVKHSCIEF